MESYEIKIVKYGIIFFGEPGTIKIDPNHIEVTTKDGTPVFSSDFKGLKRANLNGINGMWTLITHDRQKCNLVVKNREGTEKLGMYTKAAGVKGLKILST